MTRPNFLLIGAGRAGTTSLYHYLRQHPAIYLSPIKETNYFARNGSEREREPGRDEYPVRTREEYEGLFQGVRDETAVGEASPRYLVAPGAAGRAHDLFPDLQLLAILRDPAERAYSSYLLHRQKGEEPRDFWTAIQEELRGTASPDLPFGCRRYLETGFYDRHLSRWSGLFPVSRIQVHLYEDLRDDGAELLRRIFTFLGVDPGFPVDTSVRHNPSLNPRRALLARAIRKRRLTSAVRRHLPGGAALLLDRVVHRCVERVAARPRLDADLRRDLVELYGDDIRRLEGRIGRNLSGWLDAGG